VGEIKKQSIANTSLSYIGAVIGFVVIYTQPLLISSADIGLLRLLYSFSWMAAVVMPLGIGTVTVRMFPKIKNETNKHNGLFALLLMLSSLGALLIGFLIYLNKNAFNVYYQRSPEFPAYFNEAIVFAFVLSLISIYSIYSSSLLKTTFTVFLTDIFTRLGQLLVVVLYHYQVIGKHVMVLLYMAVFLVQLVLLILYLVKHGAVSFRINWAFFKSLDLKQIVAFSLLMTITSFASLGIKFIDQLMIGHFLNEKLVGIYATCIMMCAVMEIPFNSLERIAQPKIAYAWSINDRAEVQKIYEMSSRYMFFAGGILFCLLWSGLDFILLFLPPEYQAGKMAFYLVSFSSLFNLLTSVNSSVILYSTKYYAASIFLFVLMAVSVLANNYFIDHYGITGAAMATLLSIGCFNFLKYVYILIYFRMQPFTKNTLYIGLCIVVCVAFIVLLPNTLHAFYKAAFGSLFSVLMFSFMNYKFNMVEEVNKVYKRFGLIK
jgi:O-antigen/teichoic acid export membrane protein